MARAKKIIITFAAVLVIFLAVGLLTGNIGIKEYAQGGVTIRYPAHWSIEPKNSNITYFMQAENDIAASLHSDEIVNIEESKFSVIDKREFLFDDESGRKGYIYLLNVPEKREVWVFEWEAYNEKPKGQIFVFVGADWFEKIFINMEFD